MDGIAGDGRNINLCDKWMSSRTVHLVAATVSHHEHPQSFILDATIMRKSPTLWTSRAQSCHLTAGTKTARLRLRSKLIAAPEIGIGFRVGVKNARGVVEWRGKGGAQERDLASKHQSQAQERAFDYPNVSGVMESLATDYAREAEWWDVEAETQKRRRV